MTGKARAFDFWMFTLVVVLAGMFAYATHKPQVYGEMAAFKLLPESAPFTELYFVDSSTLPTKTVSNGTLAFTFGIHNVEGATTTYPYQVYLRYASDQKVALTKGVVTLGNNASTTVHVKHILPILNLKTDAVVELVANNQQISFHLVPAK